MTSDPLPQLPAQIQYGPTTNGTHRWYLNRTAARSIYSDEWTPEDLESIAAHMRARANARAGGEDT